MSDLEQVEDRGADLALVILLANPPLMTFWVILGYVLLIISRGADPVVHGALPAGRMAALSTTPKRNKLFESRS